VAVFGFLIFGGKKLPEFARGTAQAIREFKNNLHGNAANAKPAEMLPPSAHE
jgi:TatA/E family protein of Tat protein translocase